MNRSSRQLWARSFLLMLCLMLPGSPTLADEQPGGEKSYDSARWDPIHFPPAIQKAKDEQCLLCHREIIQAKPIEVSPAGVKAADAKAWYQTLSSYQGNQEDFHVRHLSTPLAQRVMNLSCNFCHQGNDPREEAPASQAGNQNDKGYSLRKMVDPEASCLRCHGRHNYEVMGLPGHWEDTGEAFQYNCLICHAGIRTTRHQVSYLKAKAIEEAAAQEPDLCYGCHGGRQWYRLTYAYPRHPWPGAGPTPPDWAKDRPLESEPAYRLETAASR